MHKTLEAQFLLTSLLQPMSDSHARPMNAACIGSICYAPAVRGIKRRRDPSVCPSVCPSLGYSTLAACSWPATRDMRISDRSADGRRSAVSRTAIGGGISSRRPRGDTLLHASSVRFVRCEHTFNLSGTIQQ